MEVSALTQNTTECTDINHPTLAQGINSKQNNPQEYANINYETNKHTVAYSLLANTNSNNNASSSSDEIVSRTCKKHKKREKSPTLDLISTDSITSTRTNTIATSNSLNTTVLSTNNSQQSIVPTVIINKKEKQRPETWNKIEQQIFFNALRQNGKNFESITQYFNARQKRYKLENHDATNVQRSKEQIRHFYYRTWHKIIKYVSVPILNGNSNNSKASANLNKNTKRQIIINDTNTFSLRDIQVKCLIAYNTLMNKSHRWNKKSALKLVELINQGWTAIREKGKITRLRMPICKVSTKLVSDLPEAIGQHASTNQTNNQQSASSNGTANNSNNVNSNNSFPHTISIRLEPRNEHAYCKVHRLAQNPFVNIELQTLQSVKFLIEFLEKKWRDRRVQFIEKFRIDLKKNKLDSESENKHSEKLIIYPSESHQLVNSLDFYESSASSTLKLFDEYQHKEAIEKNKPNSSDLFMDNDDETMMVDDYALIAAKNNQKKPINIQQPSTKRNRNYFQLSAQQLRSGLTVNTSQLTSSLTKEHRDLTFTQIYLALNKPSIIKFEYDWISSSKQPIIISSNETNTEAVFSTSSSLIYNQNQRQRFYIDTLASVAASFLKDLQNSNTKAISNQSNLNLHNSNQQKSPPKQFAAPVQHQSLAIIQPASESANVSTTTHIVPLDTVLQRLNDEQSTKTRKLLSDLSSTKRRSRTRKQIMVVNTSSNNASMRNVILPKLNFLNGQQISLDLSTGENNQQQNIVLSGPVAAVARQIVNTATNNNSNINSHNASNNFSSSVSAISTNNCNLVSTTVNPVFAEQPLPTQQQYESTENHDQYIILRNYNQENQNQLPEAFDSNTNYSNLMPEFFASLTAIATENSSSSNSNNENNVNNQIEMENNKEIVGSPHTLADMSLLDLSINNTDSLFGLPSNTAENKQVKQSNDQINNLTTENGAFSILKIGKVNSNQALNQTKSGHSNNTNSLCGNFSHKRSDIIVEWTDSMNDVSLTGILNEFQSPDKQQHHMQHTNKNTALVHVLNENSRDSIFFNLDTIMDINNHSNI